MDRYKPMVAATLIGLSVVGGLTIKAVGHQPGKTYEHKMHGPVSLESAERFRELIVGKGRTDTVNIHIESFGGLVLSMNKIIHYIRKTEARVHCTTDSHAASAAAMILMSCDRVTIADNAMILFHITQVCSERSFTGQCRKHSAATKKKNPRAYATGVRFLTKIKHLLTNKEWTAILKGTDITLRGKEVMKRLRHGGVR